MTLLIWVYLRRDHTEARPAADSGEHLAAAENVAAPRSNG